MELGTKNKNESEYLVSFWSKATHIGKPAFTDYPILELLDESGKAAPIRSCFVLNWDNDKYAYIYLPYGPGIIKEIKRGYIYANESLAPLGKEFWKGIDNG